MKKKDCNNAPIPGANSGGDDVTKRIYLHTKSSKFHNITTMMQTHKLWKALIPHPYDYMSRLGSFETEKSDIDSSLWFI